MGALYFLLFFFFHYRNDPYAAVRYEQTIIRDSHCHLTSRFYTHMFTWMMGKFFFYQTRLRRSVP